LICYGRSASRCPILQISLRNSFVN